METFLIIFFFLSQLDTSNLMSTSDIIRIDCRTILRWMSDCVILFIISMLNTWLFTAGEEKMQLLG